MSENLQQSHLEITQARRTGAAFFAISGLLQGMFFLLFIFALSTYRYYRESGFYRSGRSWNGWLHELAKDDEAFIAGFMALLVLILVSWAFGRWAGRLIGIEKRGFGWVAPLLALGASMVTAFVFIIVLAYLDHHVREDVEEEFFMSFALPWVVITGIYFVGGLIPSLLSGLVVRQRLRTLEEKAALHARQSETTIPQTQESEMNEN